jgi:hypothetical protein
MIRPSKVSEVYNDRCSLLIVRQRRGTAEVFFVCCSIDKGVSFLSEAGSHATLI